MDFQTYELLTTSNQPFFCSATQPSDFLQSEINASRKRQVRARFVGVALLDAERDALVDEDLPVLREGELEPLHRARRRALEVRRVHLPPAREPAVARAMA